MKKLKQIDKKNDEIWNSLGGKIACLIEIQQLIKEELEINESCEITLPTRSSSKTIEDVVDYLKDVIVDFNENFNVKINGNIIKITRIGNTESYKVDAFKS